MTPLQEKMISKIAFSEFTPINGLYPETPEDTSTWIDVIIETNQDKGVFTSLVNAGLAEKLNDEELGLTQKGLDELNKIWKSNDTGK